MGNPNSNSGRGEQIKVVIRSRPLNDEEKAARTPSLVHCDTENHTVSVSTQIGSKRGKKTYNFDMAFGQYASQAEIYNAAIAPIVKEVIQGYNCTVFAYGQTGTGKTHTMEGNIDDPELKGVIPRAVENIFDQLKCKEEAEYSAKVSFLELYNEELQDLLSVDDEKKLRIMDDRSKLNSGVSCLNLEETIVKSPQDIIEIMRKAMSKRQVAATNLNKTSSRSHCIFTLTLHIKETTPEGEDLLKVGKLNLVDLAGSESVGRSGAKDKRAREAGNINRSLLTLGRVISALVERTPHIPYRDSKLTRLLQESLGGKAKTCIIATVAPSVQCLDETLSTLDYASRAKNIKNKPEANQKMTKRALIREYADDIQRLRDELSAARAKDGVFLQEDTYNSMVTDIESKKNQLEELETALEQKLTEFKKLKQLFDDTSKELDDTKADLDQTKTKLTSTELELGGTKIKLLDEKNRVKEGRIIIEAHRKTEEKLHSTSKLLQETIENISEDTARLHSKIERTQDLEKSNFNFSSTYSESTKSSLNQLKEVANVFTSTQISAYASMVDHMEKLQMQSSEHTSQAVDMVKTLLADKKEALLAIETKVKDNQASFKEEKVMHLLSTAEENLNRNKDKLGQLESDSLDKITEVVTLMQDGCKQQSEWTEELRQMIHSQKDSIEKFSQTFTESIQQLSQSISQAQSDNIKMLESQESKMNSFVKAEEQNGKAAVAELQQQFSDLLNEFITTRQSRTAEEVNAFTEENKQIVDSIRSSSENFVERLGNIESEASAWLQEQTGSNAAFSEKQYKFIEDMSNLTSTSETKLLASNEGLRESSANLESMLKDQLETLGSDCEGMNEKLLLHVGQVVDDNKEFTDKMNVAHGALVSKETDAGLERESIAKSVVTIVHKAKTDSESFNADLQKDVQSLSEDTDKLVNESLQRYQPSGETPNKRQYEYPQEIACTSPEASILERARARPENEVSPLQQTVNKPRANSIDSPFVPKDVDNENNASISNLDVKGIEDETPLKRDSSVPPPKRRNLAESFRLLSEEEIMGLKVVDLRKELSARSCPQFGTKAILQQRLLDYQQATPNSS